MIQIPARLLSPLARAAMDDHEDARAITNVMFMRDEVIACNGHILVRFKLEKEAAGDWPPVGVRRSHLLVVAGAAAASRNTYATISIAPTGDHVEFWIPEEHERDPKLCVRVPAVYGIKYPPVDRVMPTSRIGERGGDGISFDAKYLDLVRELASAEGSSSGIRIDHWGTLLDPTLMSCGALRVVVMPMRGMEPEPGAPRGWHA